MAKSGGDYREGHVESDSTVVAEGLSERVSRKVALEAGFATPGFDQAAGVRDCYGGMTILSTEQCGLLIALPSQDSRMDLQPALKGDIYSLVDCAQAVFPAFLLPDPEGVPGLEQLYLSDCQAEQVADSQIGVDPDGEEREVAWLVGEVGADCGNVVEIPDWIDGDTGTGLWVVEVLVFLHWAPFLSYVYG